MKKLFFPVLALVMLTSCIDITTPFNDDTMRDAAYANLSDTEKESLTINWKDAQVVQGYYSTKTCTNGFVSNKGETKCFVFSDPGLKLSDSQTLGAVVFNTNNDPLLGPLIVIMEPENNLVVGRVMRY